MLRASANSLFRFKRRGVPLSSVLLSRLSPARLDLDSFTHCSLTFVSLAPPLALSHTPDEDLSLSNESIFRNINDIFMAGSDTTATTISASLYEVSCQGRERKAGKTRREEGRREGGRYCVSRFFFLLI